MTKETSSQTSLWLELRSLMLMMRRVNTQCFNPMEAGNTHSNNPPTFLQAQIIIFLYANKDQPIYQKGIEKEFDIRKPTVTKILQTMEKNGFIVRHSVERDARLKQIVLTRKGTEHYAHFQEHVEEFDRILCKNLTQDEIDNLLHIADKIKNNFIQEMQINPKDARKELEE